MAALEHGVRPWLKPWSAEHTAGRITRPLRFNGVPYQGINVLMLWAESVAKGYAAPIWMTFRQARELGGHVRKGEHGSLVVYADRIRKTGLDVETGDETERAIPFLKGYTVFNVEQVEGLPAHFHTVQAPQLDPVARIARADAFFAATGADIRHGGNQAYLPTITSLHPERVREVIDAYIQRGFRSIYLRPVNYHGFARKNFPASRDDADSWCAAYRAAIRYVFEYNAKDAPKIREYGLELALSRIFRPSYTGHVDLRSPNPVAADYLVVDHDGRLYPSDEARMLSRIGRADLSIGDLEAGIDRARAGAMSWNQMNEVHEDCIHCAFQPYCGIDNVDDLSRYGRIDLPKHLTWFCRVNEDLFAMVFEMLQQARPDDLINLSGHLTGRFDLGPFHGPYVHD